VTHARNTTGPSGPSEFSVSYTNPNACPQAHREGAATPDEDGDLPLHIATAFGAPNGSIKALLEAHPAGAASANIDGNLPLHLLSASSKGLVVEALVAAHPQGAGGVNREGSLPLHVALAARAPPEVVHTLLRHTTPTHARQPNGDGDHAVHLAVANHAPAEVVEALLRAHPQGARELNKHGAHQEGVALHVAVANHAEDRVVQDPHPHVWKVPVLSGPSPPRCLQVLLAAYGEAVGRCNRHGDLPLHVAVSNNASTSNTTITPRHSHCRCHCHRCCQCKPHRLL
jgi:ankyrin repeat protein